MNQGICGSLSKFLARVSGTVGREMNSKRRSFPHDLEIEIEFRFPRIGGDEVAPEYRRGFLVIFDSKIESPRSLELLHILKVLRTGDFQLILNEFYNPFLGRRGIQSIPKCIVKLPLQTLGR